MTLDYTTVVVKTDTLVTEVTVYRNGSFDVAAPEVEGKCGVFGKTAFRFEAWFTATEKDLDERGFIVDNADLFRYFRDTYGGGVDCACSPFVSCELMVLRAVNDWRARWPSARKVVARVWGLEDVTYVEASWVKPGSVLRATAPSPYDLSGKGAITVELRRRKKVGMP